MFISKKMILKGTLTNIKTDLYINKKNQILFGTDKKPRRKFCKQLITVINLIQSHRGDI